MDGVHPTHNVLPSYVWIRTGKDKEIKSNSGRQRMNINGVYSPQDHEIIERLWKLFKGYWNRSRIINKF